MSGFSFYKSAELTPSAVQEKYRLWNSGEQIHSELVAIGHLALSPGEIGTLEHALFGNFQDLLLRKNPIVRQFAEVRESLKYMACEDIARGGVTDPNVRESIHGGFFIQKTNTEPWHVGDPQSPTPTVIYSVAHGAAPTRGLRGALSREDVIWEGGDSIGHFKPGVPIGEDARLQPVDFPEGTVLRYTPLDGHASGNDVATTNGLRLAAQVKIALGDG